MSMVTDVILITMCGEGEEGLGLSQLQEWLKANESGQILNQVDQYAKQKKGIQCDIYIGGFNHFDIDGFVKKLNDCEFKFPECVQLFIKEEDYDQFEIWNIEVEL